MTSRALYFLQYTWLLYFLLKPKKKKKKKLPLSLVCLKKSCPGKGGHPLNKAESIFVMCLCEKKMISLPQPCRWPQRSRASSEWGACAKTFWATHFNRKWTLLSFYMPWRQQICITKFRFSYEDDLSESFNETTPKWCKKSKSGWRRSKTLSWPGQSVCMEKSWPDQEGNRHYHGKMVNRLLQVGHPSSRINFCFLCKSPSFKRKCNMKSWLARVVRVEEWPFYPEVSSKETKQNMSQENPDDRTHAPYVSTSTSLCDKPDCTAQGGFISRDLIGHLH